MACHMSKFSLYAHTLRYLKPGQVAYRLYYAARRGAGIGEMTARRRVPLSRSIVLATSIPRKYSRLENGFVFLNLRKVFADRIDWEFAEYGKLWLYHLNYFDYLNQPGMTPREGLTLIGDFLRGPGYNGTAYEPYPTSLRVINWIKFLVREGIHHEEIDRSLFSQARHLANHLEYHLLGNHLLENGCALLFAAYYFGDEGLFRLARKVLIAELAEQVMDDGAHFELSPLYHQVLLDRLLDCVNLVRNNDLFENELEGLLAGATALMTGWLRNMTFSNGKPPLFNDAVYGIAPSCCELFEYAERLGIAPEIRPLGESGYRREDRGGAELIVDVGAIGPDYIPGHAHADTLNFELALFGHRIIVDSGASTYENSSERLHQRGTAAHNTVTIDHADSSEVWASFRVARRARPFNLERVESDGAVRIACSHDGYRRLRGRPIHRREWLMGDHEFIVRDSIEGPFCEAVSRYHFHPDVKVELSAGGEGRGVVPGGASFSFSAEKGSARLVDTTYHPEFNIAFPNRCLDVFFDGSETLVTFCY